MNIYKPSTQVPKRVNIMLSFPSARVHTHTHTTHIRATKEGQEGTLGSDGRVYGLNAFMGIYLSPNSSCCVN